MKELSFEERQRLLKSVQAQQPPTIGVVGLSGSGKSSTVNGLFKTKLPISHVAACTKEFWKVPLQVRATRGEFSGQDLQLEVIDAPGLGEDKRRDPAYLTMYGKNLSACDVILWVISARNRALALDQTYLEILSDFLPKMVFGLSQVDLVVPNNWKAGSLVPTQEQQANIEAIVADRTNSIESLIRRKITLIPYASERGYNMSKLFTELLKAAPKGRKWLFHPLLNYDLDAWIAQSALRTEPGRKVEDNRGFDVGTAFRQIFGMGQPANAENKLSQILDRAVNDVKGLTEQELAEAAEVLSKRREP